MPDTNKHAPSPRIPPQQEFVRPQELDPQALAKLLDEWMLGDETEQRETFDCLLRSLDEDRPKGYKLFS
jgi:hypothetical protein